MDAKTEITKKYRYLKSRKRLDLLKAKTGITYQNIIRGVSPATDNALMFVRQAYEEALKLEIMELEIAKKSIEDKMVELHEVLKND